VSNYRSIKDKINLSFEATNDKELVKYYVIEHQKGLKILKLGVIYDANASCKINILFAFKFLQKLVLKPLETKNKNIEFTPFHFNTTSHYKSIHFEISFSL